MADAVWFVGPRQVEIRTEADQPVEPGEVRIRTLFSGVSAGSELLVYRGEAPADLEPDLPTVVGSFGFPVKFGYASVGRVVEIGPGVDRPVPGDVAFVHHPHQTGFVVPAASTIALPAGLAPELGVLVANLETAVTIVLDASVRLSEAVLVTGQGVLGLLVTMLLRRSGAGPIITVDLHRRRRRASETAGADHALEPGRDLVETILDRTAGRGVDVSIEASGSPAALQACIDCTAYSGTIVAASWYGTRAATLALGASFHRKRLRLVSSQVSTLDPALRGRWDRERRLDLVTSLLCDLPLVDLVTHRFPFREAARAYALLDEQPGDCLQVVLEHA